MLIRKTSVFYSFFCFLGGKRWEGVNQNSESLDNFHSKRANMLELLVTLFV